MSKIFQVPSTLVKVMSMNHWWRLIFDTQENVTSEQMSVVLNWMQKLGWLTFNAHQIEATDIIDLPELKSDSKKTPSQIQRAVLYRMWEKDNEGYEFPMYYEVKMSRIIDWLKGKLE